MIVLFTDFGERGPYVGQMLAAVYQYMPHACVVELMNDAPQYNPHAAGHLLAAYSAFFSVGDVFLAVVDPGVGSAERRPCVLQADGRWYVGPDNGLFDVLAACAHEVQWFDIQWQPPSLSSSFHGRDLFAPVAALLSKVGPEGVLIPRKSQTEITYAPLYEVIYIDAYGNCICGVQANGLAETKLLSINGHSLSYARTFSAVDIGEAFWYSNSSGLLEIAVNQGRADKMLNIAVGDKVVLD